MYIIDLGDRTATVILEELKAIFYQSESSEAYNEDFEAFLKDSERFQVVRKAQ